MRTRITFAAAIVIASAASSCFGEAWVTKMFSTTKHDFGTVARGADTSFRFAAKNIYKQDVELVSVSSSCGCTTPTIEKKVLKTGEVGYVTATFNTRTFTGVHGATLTVEVRWNDNGNWIDGETQLRVDGNIRGDIVFTPGAVRFDDVDQGTTTEQKVEVTYAGRSDWKIVDVRGASDALEVELTQTQRYSGRVAYNLLVRLKNSAPAGYFNDQLVLVTNDEENPRIPIYVAGRVVPQISVAPESLLLGDVAQGQQVSKKIIVRGKKPFKIVSIHCNDEQCFQFKTDNQARDRHIVDVIFNAKKSAGAVKEAINIATDLGNKFRTVLTAYATILPSAPATTANASGAANAVVAPVAASTAGADGTPKGEVARQ
ncbi:MAG TPA: DUF1573 domain-containing protein [Lacipirellulaceae bacterium]|nr:DUF1573 domain-containing protein [Lacipirellulaceae bacterium]